MQRWTILGLMAAIGLTGCEDAVPPRGADIDGARIIAADTEPGNWLAHGRTYSEQRYSPLAEINASNVTELGLAWSVDMLSLRGLEASPIVADGMMFTTASWSKVTALKAATGEIIWEYDPEVPGEWGRYVCCDVVNRGVAVWKDRVYVGTIDGRLVSLDAATGDVIWDISTIDRTKPYSITGAPRIIDGKVIIGNGGAELGVRGYITAYDWETGDQLWRFYTVPGNPDEPFEHPELELAADTWAGGKWWEIGGGGTAWDSMAYDPELDLLYVGTGNGSPWNRHIRSPGGGDNLYLSSILAIRPDSGRLAWHYQTTPGDNWDYTATQHLILADLEIQGELRQVIMQAPKNGFFYVIDRETGELISAEAYTDITWASHVDLESGRPVETATADYKDTGQMVQPGPQGGHNWHPMAFSPDTGLVYIPEMKNRLLYMPDRDFVFREKAWNLGVSFADMGRLIEEMMMGALSGESDEAGSGQPLDLGGETGGSLLAWDPVSQKEVWSVPHPTSFNGGILTTASNLLFQGTGDGRFAAYRADDGTKLWETRVNIGIIAPPVTFRVDGEQYVTVMAGWGGGGPIVGGAGAANFYANNGHILTFKLGAGGDLPELPKRNQAIPEPPAVIATLEAVGQGRDLYNETCGVCHGFLAVSSGLLPDLRFMTEGTHDQFQEIVRGGSFEAHGMASFADLLSQEDVEAVRAYIVTRAVQDRAIATAIAESVSGP